MNATWSIVLTVLGLLATAISAIAAIGSWRAARRSDQAATTLANIERDRRHTELTPIFDRTCYRSTVGERANLDLTFTGPPGLDRLDGAEVTIRDDRSNRTPTTAADPSAEELAAAIWGPLRFCPHVNDADKLGAPSPPFPWRSRKSYGSHWNPASSRTGSPTTATGVGNTPTTRSG